MSQIHGASSHNDLRFNSEFSLVGISLSTRILFPFGCSNSSADACKHNLFTLALPRPYRVSPATGQPISLMWSLIWDLLPVSIFILIKL